MVLHTAPPSSCRSGAVALRISVPGVVAVDVGRAGGALRLRVGDGVAGWVEAALVAVLNQDVPPSHGPYSHSPAGHTA